MYKTLEGDKKIKLGMCSNLSYYQPKSDCYLQRMLYVNLTIITRKKCIVNSKKKIRLKIRLKKTTKTQKGKGERKREEL